MTAPKTVSKAKGSYLFVSVCILLLLALMGLFLAWGAGSVRGEEFDVVSWDIRSFSYVRNPLTGQQITGIKHDVVRSGIDAKILPHLTGGPLAPKGARWDLLFISRGPISGVGDARILLDYVGTWGSADLYWSEWTTAHPTEAPILWSAVRDAVHLSRYEKLPDLFEAARGLAAEVAMNSGVVQAAANQKDERTVKFRTLVNAIMLPLTLEESKSALKSGDASLSQAIAKQGLTYGASQELTALSQGRWSAVDGSEADLK